MISILHFSGSMFIAIKLKFKDRIFTAAMLYSAKNNRNKSRVFSRSIRMTMSLRRTVRRILKTYIHALKRSVSLMPCAPSGSNRNRRRRRRRRRRQYTCINKFKKSYQLRSTVVKAQNGYLHTDSEIVSNRWKNYIFRLLNVRGVNRVRQAEILVHTAEQFVPSLVLLIWKLLLKNWNL
jgi:hypothetical protein